MAAPKGHGAVRIGEARNFAKIRANYWRKSFSPKQTILLLVKQNNSPQKSLIIGEKRDRQNSDFFTKSITKNNFSFGEKMDVLVIHDCSAELAVE
jgi:hypothetical protein